MNNSKSYFMYSKCILFKLSNKFKISHLYLVENCEERLLLSFYLGAKIKPPLKKRFICSWGSFVATMQILNVFQTPCFERSQVNNSSASHKRCAQHSGRNFENGKIETGEKWIRNEAKLFKIQKNVSKVNQKWVKTWQNLTNLNQNSA